jgi:hypothetical protein
MREEMAKLRAGHMECYYLLLSGNLSEIQLPLESVPAQCKCHTVQRHHMTRSCPCMCQGFVVTDRLEFSLSIWLLGLHVFPYQVV